MKSRSVRMSVCALLVACPFLMPVLPGRAQERPSQVRVIHELKHDVSPPLGDLPSSLPTGHALSQGQAASGGRTAVKTFSFADSAAQISAGPLVNTAPGIDFDGIGYPVIPPGNLFGAPSANGAVGVCVPPDNCGAGQFVEVINVFYAVYDKTTGDRHWGPAYLNRNLWRKFGGPCQTTNMANVIVNFDKSANRWIFTHHAELTTAGVTTNVQCVAVSTTSNAIGTYYRYAFPLSTNPVCYSTVLNGCFLGDAKLGVWPDAYYVAVGEQLPPKLSYVSGLACALDRTNMLAGNTATAQCFDAAQVPALATVKEMLPSDLDGTIPPPARSPNFFMNLGAKALNLWQFHVDFTTPANSTFTGPTALSVPSYQQACLGSHGACIPQEGSTQALSALADRLMYRLAYRNFSDHDSIVVTHTVNPPNSAFAAVRWYEIRCLSNVSSCTPAAPAIYQQGTYTPDNLSRWMASAAMDQAGDIAIGYSVSDSSIFPAIKYSGWEPTDPLGQLEAETSIIEGTGSQQPSNHNWGNYTSMSIDPADDCTFWYTNEYWQVSDANDWSTHIGSFKFNGCT